MKKIILSIKGKNQLAQMADPTAADIYNLQRQGYKLIHIGILPSSRLFYGVFSKKYVKPKCKLCLDTKKVSRNEGLDDEYEEPCPECL